MDILTERHVECGWGEVDAALLRTYCTRVFDDCCWLRDEVGLPYDAMGRTVEGLAIGLLKWLHKTTAERGVWMMFLSPTQSLLIDSSGAVTGLRASRDGESFLIEAGGVILATGGFQGNRHMLMEHAGQRLGQDVVMVGSPDNTGNGHLMALEAGAAMRHLKTCHIRTTDVFFGNGPSRYLMHIYPMGIYFNRNFERFIDEGVADSDTIANAIALQPGSSAGLIFDDKARGLHPEEYANYPRREQVICTAGSIAELAGKMGLSPDGLCRLVETFNANVRNGRASGPNLEKTRSAVPLDQPPYHGFHPVRPAINHTLGGVVVDGESCQAMDGNGQPIKGLYAAGTVMNWACGRSFEVNGVTSFKGSYHAGATSGAGIALMSGRLAAQKALDKIRKREVG